MTRESSQEPRDLRNLPPADQVGQGLAALCAVLKDQDSAAAVVDAEHQVLYVNEFFRTLFGLSDSDDVQLLLLSYFGPSFRSCCQKAQTGQPTRSQLKSCDTGASIAIHGADGTLQNAPEVECLFTAWMGDAGAVRPPVVLTFRLLGERTIERPLGATLDALPDMIYRVDLDGVLTFVSKAIERVFGYNPEEAIGSNALLHYANPDDRQRYLDALEAGHGMVQNFDLQLLRKDGRPLWVSLSASFITDAQGNHAGIEGVIRDIDQRKRDELALIENNNLVQALLNASSDAIMLFDAQGILWGMNQVMAQRFGSDIPSLLGTCIWDLFPLDVAEKRRAATQQVIDTCKPIQLTDERTGRFFMNSIYPVLNAQGQVDKVAVFSRETTSEVLNERKIARYVAEIEQSNRDLEAFAFAASHDLREPLRMIGSFSDLLRQKYSTLLTGDGTEYLDFIKAGVDRMSLLVRDLLDYARIGQHSVAPGPIDMALLIDQVWQDNAISVQESGATLTVGANLPGVTGYELLVERLLSNLLSNALHYGRQDGQRLHITVGWDDAQQAWFVADNGPGIEPRFHQHVFAMFKRLSSGWDGNNSGLGLAIVQRVVDRHGGRVWLESDLGLGATFYFTLVDPMPLAAKTERPPLRGEDQKQLFS